jgi:cytochrome c biogenesis protein CcdA
MTFLPLLFAGVVGFMHAFEADHLLAVSSMVTRRNSALMAAKDGVFWGLGHSSTILIIGILMILAQVSVAEHIFHIFEAGVGLMLIVLGLQRLRDAWRQNQAAQRHALAHQHHEQHSHKMAYSVGLVHGLAGSGSLILLVMSEWKGAWEGIAYLVVFGAGSILGMLLASSVFFMPFSKKISQKTNFQVGLTLLSSALCIAFGGKILIENLGSL